MIPRKVLKRSTDSIGGGEEHFIPYVDIDSVIFPLLDDNIETMSSYDVASLYFFKTKYILLEPTGSDEGQGGDFTYYTYSVKLSDGIQSHNLGYIDFNNESFNSTLTIDANSVIQHPEDLIIIKDFINLKNRLNNKFDWKHCDQLYFNFAIFAFFRTDTDTPLNQQTYIYQKLDYTYNKDLSPIEEGNPETEYNISDVYLRITIQNEFISTPFYIDIRLFQDDYYLQIHAHR